LPDWIALHSERQPDAETGAQSRRPFSSLRTDPLFWPIGTTCLLPYLPPPVSRARRGAAIICPGGNLEFAHPREGEPVARWAAEALGIPAFVLKYRLLPGGATAFHQTTHPTRITHTAMLTPRCIF